MSVSGALGGPNGNPGLAAGLRSWILPYMLDGAMTHRATGPAAVRPGDDRFVGLAAELGEQFAARATQHDRDNTFVEENFRALRDSRYTALACRQSSAAWAQRSVRCATRKRRWRVG